MTVTYLSYKECPEDLQMSASRYAANQVIANFNPENMTIAHINQKVVGILIYKEPSPYYQGLAVKPCMYLLRIEVDKEHQRKGIATELVNRTLLKLATLSLVIEFKIPKEGESEIYSFIKSLRSKKELAPFSIEKETYMRYIIEYASDGARGSG